MSNTAAISQRATNTRRLTDEQLQTFRREGYLVYPDPVLLAAEFDALKAHFEEKLANLAPEIRPENMDCPHFTDPSLFRWLFSDSVLDLVESVIGPDIALFASHFICKPKGDGRKVPWHEDSFYWKGMMEPMEGVTCWLAIDPSTAENGAMRVIPRTFHGYSEYDPVDPVKNVFPTEIKQAMRDDSKAITLVLQPNHASLHDSHLMHGSAPNTSSMRRCGYTMRYVPTHVKLLPDGYKYLHLYLARGKDKAGNRYGDPSKTYESLARFRENSSRKVH
jgi:hypothetical protein